VVNKNLLEGFGFDEIINRDLMRERPDQSGGQRGLRDEGRTVRGLTQSNLLQLFRRGKLRKGLRSKPTLRS
jgi:hypothetical protein